MNKTFLFVTFLLTSLSAYASPHVATLVHKKGDVKLLTQPKKRSSNRSPEALYEGLYYRIKKAKLGTKVKKGEVVQTGTNGRAKLIFQNGDQFSVGPGTSYRMTWIEKGNAKSAKGSSLNIFYGKVRAVISHKGPRRKMDVKTPSAVAGVRGTDFYASYSGNEGTKVTVLRGKVSVKPKNDKTAKPTFVKSGYSGVVGAADTGKKAKDKKGFLPTDVEIKEANRKELLEIQRVSTISEPQELSQLPKPVQKQIASLEKKAHENCMQDIKETSPKFYEKLTKDKSMDSKKVNTMVVSELYKAAPAAPKKFKPSAKDLEEIEDVYKTYFQ